jgi:anti-sigma factor RsiW
MTDTPLNFISQPNEQPGDDEAREARHQVLATLLGAYADGELPPETCSQIDAHLLGCARCRREVAMHGALHARLADEPGIVASTALRERVMARVASAQPASAHTNASDQARSVWTRWTVRFGAVAVACAVGVAAILAVRAARQPARPAMAVVQVATVPVFAQILADYQRVTAGDLPGRARDLDAVRAAVPFPVEMLPSTSARLLAAWSTDLGGEPAAVLAYRWRDRLVLQYLIAEPALFRHPGTRAPVAAGELITASESGQGLVAWAAPESGVVLVADVTPSELAALRVGVAGR